MANETQRSDGIRRLLDKSADLRGTNTRSTGRFALLDVLKNEENSRAVHDGVTSKENKSDTQDTEDRKLVSVAKLLLNTSENQCAPSNDSSTIKSEDTPEIKSINNLVNDVEQNVGALNIGSTEQASCPQNAENPISIEEPKEVVQVKLEEATMFSYMEHVNKSGAGNDLMQDFPSNGYKDFDYSNANRFESEYDSEDIKKRQMELDEFVESGNIWEAIRNATEKSNNENCNIIPAGADLGSYMRACQAKINKFNKSKK